MLVLGIETATDVCAVGLVDGDRDLADLSLLRPRGHGAKLAGLVNAALEAAGVLASDLDAVAVSSGPGSYTGLRIGVSTAKGLCLATGAALVSVPTLQAVAETLAYPSLPPLIIALPSRRGEVYASVLQSEPDGWSTRREPAAVELADLTSWLPSADAYAITGPAASLVTTALRDGPIAQTLITVPSRPSGLVVARMGRQRVVDGITEDVAAFEPAYLKPFVSGGV